MFERLGLLKKKNNEHRRSYPKLTTLASSMIQKDFKSLIPCIMRKRVELVISCKEDLKGKAHTVDYTKERDEDKESVGSSCHVTIHNEHDSLPQIKIDEDLEDIVWFYHISFNDNDPLEEEDAVYTSLELEEGVKTTIDPLKECFRV